MACNQTLNMNINAPKFERIFNISKLSKEHILAEIS